MSALASSSLVKGTLKEEDDGGRGRGTVGAAAAASAGEFVMDIFE